MDPKFNKAIELISKSNSPKVSFRVPINDSYSHVHEILIHESNSALISQLSEAGYSLCMTSKGLNVDVIGKLK